jgi:type IV pilus assembly protein PilV
LTLVEILTAILVIGVGLVGVASLSLANVRTTISGYIQSQATILGDELADTMRANLAAYESADFSSTPASTTKYCLTGTICNANEQARYDIQKWLENIGATLPGGVAAICMDSTPDDGQPGSLACDGAGMNTVKIFWLDSRNQELLAEGETFQRHVLTITP